MAMKVKATEIWAGTVPDRPGGLADTLTFFAAVGANLELVVARRSDRDGHGAVLISPLKGVRQLKAAEKLGFVAARSLHVLRVEGPDKRGRGAAITTAIARERINLYALSTCVIGKKFVTYLGFDSETDSTKAAKILKKLK